MLPAAAWGERTGTFTNADRTVHLSEKAVDPPGDARSDLDIFLDFARRMDFRQGRGPLSPGTTPSRRSRPGSVLAWAARATTAAITYEHLGGAPASSGRARP